MTATIRRVASVVTILVFIAACGSSPSNDNSGPVDITVNSNGTSDLTLFVSNQSYRDSTVDITVTLDGETIIDRGFNVEDQHNYIEHRIRLSTRLPVKSRSGVALWDHSGLGTLDKSLIAS